MKKIITILTILIIYTNSVFSQKNNQQDSLKFLKNCFYLVPIPSFSNTFQISYERIFRNAKKGILICGGFIPPGGGYDVKSGFTEEIQFRFYLNDIRNSGNENKFQFAFYFSPFAAHKYFKTNGNNYDYSNSISSGLVSGLKGTFSRFTFDIYVGGGFIKSFTNINSEVFVSKSYLDDHYTGVLPKVGVQLGFSF